MLSREGEMYVCGAANLGKLGIFRLEERLASSGNSSNVIDWPWKLTEEVPPKFYCSKEDNDVFDKYDKFKKHFTS